MNLKFHGFVYLKVLSKFLFLIYLIVIRVMKQYDWPHILKPVQSLVSEILWNSAPSTEMHIRTFHVCSRL
jgi:hypothetical protein